MSRQMYGPCNLETCKEALKLKPPVFLSTNSRGTILSKCMSRQNTGMQQDGFLCNAFLFLYISIQIFQDILNGHARVDPWEWQIPGHLCMHMI